MIKIIVNNPDGTYHSEKNCLTQNIANTFITSLDLSLLYRQVDIDISIIWAELRANRYMKLAATDWTQLADAPWTYSQKLEWATYRQALRDLPAKPDLDPGNPVWPTPPF